MTAWDDPEALEVFTSLQDEADETSASLLFADPQVIGNREMKAYQSGSDVILQKSLREGFGLTVAEAMWKGTP